MTHAHDARAVTVGNAHVTDGDDRRARHLVAIDEPRAPTRWRAARMTPCAMRRSPRSHHHALAVAIALGATGAASLAHAEELVAKDELKVNLGLLLQPQALVEQAAAPDGGAGSDF